MSETGLLAGVMAQNNTVSAKALANRLNITENELAEVLGLSRDTVSTKTQAQAQPAQDRMRDLVEIINRALPWAGTELAAFVWYCSQPLPGYAGKTAQELVSEGDADAIKFYLRRIAAGGYA